MIDTISDQIYPKIRMLLPSLTQKEQSIAEFFLKPDSVEKTTSINEIAESLNVSIALVVKVAQKLGYSGFKELKNALLSHSQSPNYLPSNHLKASDDCAAIVNKVLQNSISALTEVLSIANVDTIDQAADALINARRIELFAVGGSSMICDDFMHKLLRIGVRASVPRDGHIMLMIASQLTPEDIVLVVSHSGQTRDLMDAVKAAKNSGAQIITITNNYNSELSRLSNFTIYAPASPEPILGRNGTARLAKLALVDCLYATIANKLSRQAEDALKKTMEIVGHLHQA